MLPPTLSDVSRWYQADQHNSCQSLRAVLVSDARLFCEGLCEVLARQSRMAVVGIAENGDQALDHAMTLHPDVILLDTGLPDGRFIVARLFRAVPEIPVVVMGVAETEQAVLAWVEAGAAGYLHRSASIADLMVIATLAMRGEQACSTKIAGAMLRRLHQLAATARDERYIRTDARLTLREREIAELVADGLSNKLIARRLHIEVATAKCHVHNILDKLNLRRRGDLARWVRQ
jgi:DNA-binding NarL/FixJ family response regulator